MVGSMSDLMSVSLSWGKNLVAGPTPEETDQAGQAQLSRRLVEGVGLSQGLLMIQTNAAYLSPMTLLELYWAERTHTPIVCVRLQGERYDFGLVKETLDGLEAGLQHSHPVGAELLSAYLSHHGIRFEHVARTLGNSIPKIITIPRPFSIDDNEGHVAATVRDIVQRFDAANRERAAVRIQLITRGREQRKVFAQKRGAAKTIQKHIRSRLTRMRIRVRIQSQGETQTAFAPTVICIRCAALWRGQMARQRVKALREATAREKTSPRKERRRMRRLRASRDEDMQEL